MIKDIELKQKRLNNYIIIHRSIGLKYRITDFENLIFYCYQYIEREHIAYIAAHVDLYYDISDIHYKLTKQSKTNDYNQYINGNINNIYDEKTKIMKAVKDNIPPNELQTDKEDVFMLYLFTLAENNREIDLNAILDRKIIKSPTNILHLCNLFKEKENVIYDYYLTNSNETNYLPLLIINKPEYHEILLKHYISKNKYQQVDLYYYGALIGYNKEIEEKLADNNYISRWYQYVNSNIELLNKINSPFTAVELYCLKDVKHDKLKEVILQSNEQYCLRTLYIKKYETLNEKEIETIISKMKEPEYIYEMIKERPYNDKLFQKIKDTEHGRKYIEETLNNIIN